MYDVSKFRTVGEWYRENRGRVPIQMAVGLERIMKDKGLTFPEAYALAVGQGSVIEIEPEGPAPAPNTARTPR